MSTGIFLVFLDRIAGESYSEFLEYLSVYFAEHDCRVHLASVKLWKLFKRHSAVVVLIAQH